MEQQARTLIDLVGHYSPSGEEKPAVDYLIQRMAELGYHKSFMDDAGNAVGIVGEGPRQVVLLGHIDTVPGEIPVRVEDDILYGRGTVDAKGPLACFTDAVADIAKTRGIDGWQFVVIGALGEERDSNGARFVAPIYKPDFAIIGEPNRWDRVSLGYKGSAWAKISIEREQTHTASGEETACEAAVAIWQRIVAWAALFNENRPKVFDKVLPTLRGMNSGNDGFVQSASLHIGMRLPIDLPPDAWYEKLAELAQDATFERLGHALPAWGCEKNSALVRAMLAAIRAEGGTPSFVYKTGTADLNIVGPAWQCPMVVYGPGDSALDHTPQERISLTEYAKAVRVLHAALRLFTAE